MEWKCSLQSQSKQMYGGVLSVFTEKCEFIEASPKQIVEDYEGDTNERILRKKYAQLLKAFIIELTNKGYAVGSVSTVVRALKSFFKYNDLPLGYVPTAKNQIKYHNRDITREEIQKILHASKPREKVFYCLMAQSGLRPNTICLLKLKHVEPEFSEGVTPCVIRVPAEISKGKFGAYFTFMGEEATKYLKGYLSTRTNTTQDDYLVCSRSGGMLDRRSATNIFARTVDGLKEQGVMDFEQKAKGKPRTVRLYNLRKFFRNHATQAGVDYVNFWMGHKTDYKAPNIPASDVHYFSKENVEFQRKLYAEKAMPFLRLETATPSETDKIISRQQKEIEKLGKEMAILKTDYAALKTNYEALTSDLEASAIETARKKLISKMAIQAITTAQNEIMQNPKEYPGLVKLIKKLDEKEKAEKTEERS